MYSLKIFIFIGPCLRDSYNEYLPQPHWKWNMFTAFKLFEYTYYFDNIETSKLWKKTIIFWNITQLL